MAVLIAAAIAADAVGVRLYQHQTVLFFVDRDRVPAQIALELLRVLIGQVLADGNNRPASSRFALRGHADACAIVQMAADGDDRTIGQIHIVIGAVIGGALLVVLDDRLAGNSKRAIELIHAAAVARRVASNAAAAHVECTCIYTYAAAVARRVVFDLAAAHVECAGISVHIHAAADGCRLVVGDLAAVHVELARKRIHAAAVFRLVVADLAAVQIECALFSVVAAHAHAAALAFVAADFRIVARDAAAVHIKCAVAHSHAAAFTVLGSRVADDAAAVQIKLAAVDLHTAASAVKEVRDLARTAAIRQGQFAAGYDLKHGHILGAALDRLAVQTDGDDASDLNGMLDLNILTLFQIIVAVGQNIILTAN